jgi:hypothetical protein
LALVFQQNIGFHKVPQSKNLLWLVSLTKDKITKSILSK